jgi:hypothetical protein
MKVIVTEALPFAPWWGNWIFRLSSAIRRRVKVLVLSKLFHWYMGRKSMSQPESANYAGKNELE